MTTSMALYCIVDCSLINGTIQGIRNKAKISGKESGTS